jgi:tetratricopeptide (TPR) repeat protein
MSERWIIPVTLGSFALLAAGLWLWMASGVEPPADRARYARNASVTIVADDEDRVRRGSGPSAPADAPWAKEIRSSASHELLADAGREFAEHLDELSAGLRQSIHDSAIGSYARGRLLERQGRQDAALAAFDAALRRDPANAAALSRRASILIALDRFEEAAATLAALAEAHPDDAAARYNHGVVLIRLGRYLRAAEQLRAAVAADPAHADAWHNIAALAQRDGRMAEARDAWEIVTRLRPNSSAAWFQLGVLHADYGHPLEAAYCFDAVVDISADDVSAHVNRGLAYAGAGLYDRALAALRTADELSPCNDVVLRCLADLREAMSADDPGASPRGHDRHVAAAGQ